MIDFGRVVMVWYCALFFLALVGPTSPRSATFFWGIFFVFLLGLAFLFGGRILGRTGAVCGIYEVSGEDVAHKSVKQTFSLLSVLAAFYISHFYTGNTPVDVLAMLLRGESVYNKYQVFTADGQQTTFTADQLPAFVCIIFTKFWFVYSFLSILSKNCRVSFSVLMCLIGAAFAILYQGLSRGTSIEIFEFVFVLWFSLYLRSFLISRASRLRVNVFLTVVAVFAVLAFNFNYSVRHEFEDVGCITNEICFDDESHVNQFFPWLAGVLYKLNGYFTFGLFFFSNFLDAALDGAYGFQFSDYIFPFRLFVDGPVRYRVCGKIIDCGPNWVPDAVFYFEFFGIVLSFFLSFVVGGVAARLTKGLNGATYFADLGVACYICLLMVSLPVGNFVFSSYPSMGLGLVMVTLSVFHRFRIL